MFGKCKACDAQAKHITSLQSEIETLRKLVHVPNTAFRIPELQLEADMILSGQQDAVYISKEDIEEAEKINMEASQLLTGMYEN